MNPQRRLRWQEGLLFAGIAGFLLLFFGRLHPYLPYDGDDWAYLFYSRGALPIWGYWNPGRIFPEIVRPLTAFAAFHFVLPLAGDISWSLAIVTAVMLTGAVLFYLLSLRRLLLSRTACGAPLADGLCLLFLVLHFLLFRSARDNNVHLLYSIDMNTVFYYLIPSLLSMGLAFRWTAGGEAFSRVLCREHPLRQGMLLAGMYLCIFSTLMSGAILPAFAAVRLLWAILSGNKKQPLRERLEGEGWSLVALALYLAMLLFEASGARAGQLREGTSLAGGMLEAARAVLGRLREVNPLAAGTCLMGLFGGFLAAGKAEGARREMGMVFLSGALLGAGITGICALSIPAYAARVDVLFGAWSCLLASGVLGMARVLERKRVLGVLLPFLALVLAFECGTRGHTFREGNVKNCSPERCVQTNNAILRQVMAADASGSFAAEIAVDSAERFSFTASAMESMLLNQGMATSELGLVTRVDPEFDEHFGITAAK